MEPDHSGCEVNEIFFGENKMKLYAEPTILSLKLFAELEKDKLLISAYRQLLSLKMCYKRSRVFNHQLVHFAEPGIQQCTWLLSAE